MFAWLIGALAIASPPRWMDAVGPAIPEQTSLRCAVSWSPQPRTLLAFSDVHGAAALWTRWDARAVVGLTLHLGATNLAVPEESRGAAAMRVTAGAWARVWGPRRRVHHGVRIGGGGPATRTSLFWVRPSDAWPHFTLSYEADVVGRRFQFTFSLESGHDEFQFVHARTSTVLTVTWRRNVAIQVGAALNVPETHGQWMAGVRWRTGRTELAVSALVPMGLARTFTPTVMPVASLTWRR